MRFHVLGLPSTQTTSEYSHCAYTTKLHRFCDMMTSLGHEVFLYASQENEAKVSKLYFCITKLEQLTLIGIKGPADNLKMEFNPAKDYWQLFNNNAIRYLTDNLQPQDFICITAGLCHKQVADAFPNHMSVEIGVGYGGVFAPYKVFESYAWMHTVYGAQTGGDPHQANGNYFDAVIPNYYDIAVFPFSDTKDDYYLYIGRLIDRKGWRIAQEVCERLGKRLIVAGQGSFDGYGEHVGVVGPQKRGELMSKAQAVFVPTQYVEPFGGVHVEAMLCGTPVITTDWGVFSETVQNYVNGFRCRSLQEFIEAAQNAEDLNYKEIREMAIENYSMSIVRHLYDGYFKRLLTLYQDGWYTTE